MTTFSTPFGLFKYTRLLFGIVSGPSAFQAMMEQVLIGLSNVKNYIDDIIPDKDRGVKIIFKNNLIDYVQENYQLHMGFRCKNGGFCGCNILGSYSTYKERICSISLGFRREHRNEEYCKYFHEKFWKELFIILESHKLLPLWMKAFYSKEFKE